MSRVEFFKSRISAYRKDISLFAKEQFGFTADEWQKAVFDDVVTDNRVSVKSGQGVGKTAATSIIVLWFLVCFPYPRIVATAPTKQQLNDVLWSEVAKWQEKSPILRKILKWTKTYIYMKGYEKRWFAVARTATKPENMQGFHEDNMLFIVDEASGVADAIMEAILGTLSGENNKLLMLGNPTRTSGVFYDSHTKDRSLYKCHTVNSEMVSRVNKTNIESLKRKYGENSNVVRVRVYGEFPKQEDDVFIQLSTVEGAISNDLGNDDTPYIIELGVDVARFGDDDTVIAPKVGAIVRPLIVKHGQNLMRTTGDILALCNKILDEFPDYTGKIYVKIDDTGLGGGVTDRLREIKREQGLDWLVPLPINAASKVPEKASKYYANFTTYMWAKSRDLMYDKEIQLPNDAELVAQFSCRKYQMVSIGKQRLESKEEMKKRGISSPDRADAVTMACLPLNIK